MLPPKTCCELDDPNGERLFAVTEFLSAQQVSSFFSRFAPKACRQEVQVTEQDVLAVKLKDLAVGLLQVLCEALELQAPITPLWRNVPYISFLQELEDCCSCSVE